MFSVHSLKFVKCGLNSPTLDKFILLCSCLRTDGADGSRHKLVPPSLFHYSTVKTLIILLQSACYPLGHQKQTHRHSKPQEKEKYRRSGACRRFGCVLSLMVHRFYLTKKKVYLMGGKLQRSREKIKPFRQPLAVSVLLLAAVPPVMQV